MAVNIDKVSATSSSSRLEAWMIHKVVLTNIEVENDKDKNGNPYHIVKFTYGNDNGDYPLATFCPVGSAEMKEGGTRKKSDKGYDMPSKEESFILTILHLFSAGGEATVDRFKKYYAKVDPTKDAETFNKFCSGISKLAHEVFIDPKKELWLKLVGNKEGYPTHPNCVSISRDGTAYISKTIVAAATDKMPSFTARELKMKEEYEANVSSGASKVDNDDDLEEAERNAKKNDLNDLNVDDI